MNQTTGLSFRNPLLSHILRSSGSLTVLGTISQFQLLSLGECHPKTPSQNTISAAIGYACNPQATKCDQFTSCEIALPTHVQSGLPITYYSDLDYHGWGGTRSAPRAVS